jgi:hypothetical protein
MRDTAAKIAVVLMNLGGPVGPESIRPFLESLFGDPAILPLPGPLRRPLAWILASARLRTAKAHYALIGGGSPLLEETMSQAIALKTELLMLLDAADVEVFIAMRHAPPSTGATAIDVSEFEPDHVVLLPLYPQFSTTTTASSLSAWQAMYTGPGENHPICCWYDNPGLVEAHAELIDRTWKAAGSPKVRLLFSAHGLPSVIDRQAIPTNGRWKRPARVGARIGVPRGIGGLLPEPGRPDEVDRTIDASRRSSGRRGRRRRAYRSDRLRLRARRNPGGARPRLRDGWPKIGRRSPISAFPRLARTRVHRGLGEAVVKKRWAGREGPGACRCDEVWPLWARPARKSGT